MPRHPRILHCVSHLALGGAERVAIEIVRALRSEIDFGVCAVRGRADGEMGRSLARELRELGVPVYGGPRVGMRYGGVLTGAAALRWAVHRHQPDLIHLHTEIPEASAAAMLTLWPGQRKRALVRTIHNSVYWHFARGLACWCDRRLGHAQIAAVSKGAMAAYLQLRRDSHTDDPTLGARLIYDGVAEPPPAPRRARQAGDPVRIAFGGRLEAEKGVDLLPEILARTGLPPGHRAELTVFGSGGLLPRLVRLARTPPPGWTLVLKSPTPGFRRQLPDFDLVIVPSRFEGLGLVAIEAFLAGVPVVATTAPGLNEVLPNGYPWQARLGDAGSFALTLTEAIASPERWDDVAEQGREFAQRRFSIKSMAAAYRALYLHSLGRPAEPVEPDITLPAGASPMP